MFLLVKIHVTRKFLSPILILALNISLHIILKCQGTYVHSIVSARDSGDKILTQPSSLTFIAVKKKKPSQISHKHCRMKEKKKNDAQEQNKKELI